MAGSAITMGSQQDIYLQQITRFLYVGLDENKYYPGCWWSHKYFELDKLPALDALLQQNPVCQELCDILIKTYEDRLYSRYDTIAFVLCKSLLRANNDMKKKLYHVAALVSRATSYELFTFVDYSRKFKTGHGQGWRRVVGDWYRSKEAMTLAAEVARVKGFRNQRHHNVVRKAHLKLSEDDHARDALVKYVMYGMKQARLIHADHTEAQPVLAYVQKVEDLRHCEDAGAAARMVRDQDFTLEHVPGHLLTNQEVWDAVLPRMPLQQLLQSLVRVHNMGFLAPASTTTAVVESLLTNPVHVGRCGITPIEVYIALRCYSDKFTPMKHEKRKHAAVRRGRRREKQHWDSATQQWVWNNDKPKHPKEQRFWGIDMPPNPTIEAALQKTLELSWPTPDPSSNKRYLITMDMRDHMFKGRHYSSTSFKPPKKEQSPPKNAKPKPGATAAPTAASSTAPTTSKTERGNKKKYAECFHYSCVTPGDAAIIQALTIYKQEKDVVLAVFTEQGVRTVELGGDRSKVTLQQAKEKLTKQPLGRVRVAAPIQWALQTRTPVDVFINIIDKQSRCMELEPKDRIGRDARGGYCPVVPPPGGPDHCPVRALNKYRQQRSRPNTRLVTMSLASHRVNTADAHTRGVLDVVGIDQHVSKLLKAFADGRFD